LSIRARWPIVDDVSFPDGREKFFQRPENHPLRFRKSRKIIALIY